MKVREGECYTINGHAGENIYSGDQSLKEDRGKKVRALYYYDVLDVVQVLDLSDLRSRFNVKSRCLDPL